MEKGQIDFAKDSVWKMIFRLAPPVMAAQLIQALYNIVDSFFIGRCSEEGLTALSIVYPLQLLMIALAVGSGVGINTAMAFFFGIKKEKRAAETAGVGTPLAFVLWLIFALICYLIMPFYARISTDSEMIRADVVRYGRIVCVFSFGLFFESIWTKILQSKGNMKLPMTAQIIGAAVNIALDPLLIFGWLGLPKLGITGAAISTVIGQIAAALIVMKRGFYKPPALKKYWVNIRNIYRLGTPNILMQSAYTFYIFGLNMILATFSDQAVTVLGLYYKWQTFFFIPLGALQTCIVPMISFNYAQQNTKRCRSILWDSFIAGAVLMGMGTLCFLFIPSQMIRFFSHDSEVLRIGVHGFRIIGLSFVPMAVSLLFPVFFQAVGSPFKSSALTVIRTVFLFVPLGWLFARFGLYYFWLTYPITEIITSAVGFAMFSRFGNTKTITPCKV